MLVTVTLKCSVLFMITATLNCPVLHIVTATPQCLVLLIVIVTLKCSVFLTCALTSEVLLSQFKIIAKFSQSQHYLHWHLCRPVNIYI